METTLITCRQCGGESPSDARFCIECGEPLASATGATTRLPTPTCAGCGAENLPGAQFCTLCGRTLAPAAAAQPWPQPPIAPPPRLRPRHAPAQAYPRHVAPPAPVAAPIAPPRPPSLARPARPARRGWSPALVVLLAGVGALIFMKALTPLLVLAVVGAALLVHQAERGRLDRGLKAAALLLAVGFTATNPRLWPMLLLVFIGLKLLRGRP